MQRPRGGFIRIWRKVGRLSGIMERGCTHRARRGFCLLLVMGPTGALLFFLSAPTVEEPPPHGTDFSRLPPINAEVGAPRAELVSCALCLEHLRLTEAPLNGRLVWRPESSQSSRSQEMSSNRDQALWDFPDVYLDSWATWTLCPVLTVLIPTTPRRKAQRDAIRTTWGRLDQYTNCSLRVVFFMSIKLHHRHSRNLLKAEHKQFHDIVVHLETPGMRNAASSTAALLVEWIPAHMAGSQFALRVTDDTHVHVRALLSILSGRAQASGAGFMFGRVSQNKQHLEGCAYMAKSEAFLRLQPVFADEDLDEKEDSLVTGRLARKAGLVTVHLEGVGPCDDREAAAELQRLLTSGNISSGHLTIRGLSPEQMALLHRSISSLPSPTTFLHAEARRLEALS